MLLLITNYVSIYLVESDTRKNEIKFNEIFFHTRLYILSENFENLLKVRVVIFHFSPKRAKNLRISFPQLYLITFILYYT